MEFVEYKEKHGACAYCGNSPVPHFPTYVFQTFNVFVGILFQKLVSLKLYRFITLCIRYIFVWIQRVHYPIAEMMGILRFSDDITLATTYRSQVIWEEARRRNTRMQQIIVFGKPIDVYRIEMRRKWYYFESIPIPYAFDQSDYAWMDDKFLLKERLSSNQIKVPTGISVMTEKAALHAFKSFKGPVVVKPRIGSRARHTTVNITTERDLLIAFNIAKQLCQCVVIEEYIPGNVCRATTITGELRGFLRAEAPFIIGDGISTVQELVAKKNSERPERVAEIILTVEHDSHIAMQGVNRSSVVELNRVITLSLHTGRLFGGVTEEYGEAIHPVIKQEIEKAAKLLSAPVIGFDVILNDPLQDQGSYAWGIIEANTLPFIDLHYLPLKGYPTNVAKHILDLWHQYE